MEGNLTKKVIVSDARPIPLLSTELMDNHGYPGKSVDGYGSRKSRVDGLDIHHGYPKAPLVAAVLITAITFSVLSSINEDIVRGTSVSSSET